MNKAFTLIEIIIVMAIIAVLATIATMGMANARTNKVLEITAKNIVFSLEEAKGKSLSGKGGENHGIYFTANSFTTFNGSSYSALDPENVTETIDSKISIVNNAPSNSVIFSRVTGNANAALTITVREINDTSNSITINVGALGDINMVQ